MNWLTRLALRLYPGWWRRRYGLELEALVEDSARTWRDAADVGKGALVMHFSDLRSPLILVLACALLGAGTGAIVVAAAPPRIASVFTIGIESSALSPESRLLELAARAWSDGNLERLVEQFGPYRGPDGRGQAPDALRQFRQDISVTRATPSTMRVSFSHAGDRTGNLVSDRLAYLMLVEHLRGADASTQGGGTSRAGERFRIVDSPRQVADRPSLLVVTGAGLGVGLLAGVVLATLRRRLGPR